MKQPQIVRLPRPGADCGADADGDAPGDADDLIDCMMMGDGDRGMAPKAAAAARRIPHVTLDCTRRRGEWAE